MQEQEFDEQTQDEQEPTTGPMTAVPMKRRWFSLNPLNWAPARPEQADSAPAPQPAVAAPITQSAPQPPEDEFTKQRRSIEQFSEDYMPFGKRLLHGAAKLVGYVLPFLAVVAVGSDLGSFYAPGLGAFSSYMIAYGVELAIASLTVVLGTAAASPERTTSHKVKLTITSAIWVVASAGSALSLYVMASSKMVPTTTGVLWDVTIGWRVASVAMFDLASVAILFWSGKSLQRFLMEAQKKQHAITAMADAEIDIRRAFQRAELRLQEDAMEMRQRQMRAEHLLRIDEVRNEAELERLRIVDAKPTYNRPFDDRQNAPRELSGATNEQSYSEYSKAPQTASASAHRRPTSNSQRARRSTAQIDSVLDALEKSKPGQSNRALARACGCSVSSVERWKQAHGK